MSSSHNTTHTNSSIAAADNVGATVHSKTGAGGSRRAGNSNKTPSIAKSKMSVSTRRRGSVMIGADKNSVQGGNNQQQREQNRRRLHIRIMDGDVDVTPEPLLQLDPEMAKQSRALFSFGAGAGGTGSESGTGGGAGVPHGTPADMHSMASIQQSAGGGVNVTAAGYGGTFVGGTAALSKPIWASTADTMSSRGSVVEDYSEIGVAEPQVVGLADVVTKHGEEERQQLTEEEKETNVEITLSETPTFWLLDLPGNCVEAGTDQVEEVKEKNAKYVKLQKDRVGNDLYAEREMQTLNNGHKVKHSQTEKVDMVEQMCMAATWDMYDTYLQVAQALDPDNNNNSEAAGDGSLHKESDDGTVAAAGADSSRGQSPADEVLGSKGGKNRDGSASVRASFVEKKTANNISVITGTNDNTTVVDSVFAGSNDNGASGAGSLVQSSAKEESPEEVLKMLGLSDSFMQNLFVMERIVVQNVYQSKLAIYRNLPVFADVDAVIPEMTEDSTSINFQRPSSEPYPPPKSSGNASQSLVSYGPHLEKLWSFSCDLTKGFSVLCMNWNKKNPDILVVGYGQTTFKGQTKGLICCWSIKNIEYPERVYSMDSGVTSVDFSSSHPNLLGVGTYDGTVCVFDVGTRSQQPVLDNLESSGKHTGPVWQILWVERERGATGEDKAQVLVSISSDGRVCQWSIRKGFEYLEVMKLKRVFQSKVSRKNGPSTGSESLINRFSSGMGLDFKQGDSNIYIAGTEDGLIHRCSCSYNEQFLATYNGHTGPVYKVTWSPYAPDVYMSASADWSLKIWHQDTAEPLVNLQPALKAVTDVSWSPFSSTIFGCTTEDAVQIFDLEVSTIDPVVTHPVEGRQLTSFAFAFNSPCVLFGDSLGEVSVMKVHNVFSDDQELLATKTAYAARLENPDSISLDRKLHILTSEILEREQEKTAQVEA